MVQVCGLCMYKYSFTNMVIILIKLVSLQSIVVTVKHSHITLLQLHYAIWCYQLKAKITPQSPSLGTGGVAVQLYPCLIWALDGSGKETLYPLYLMRLGGPQGWSGWVQRGENLLPPQDFKPQTIQPMASHNTDYAIPVLHCSVHNKTANVLTTFRHVHATTVSVEKQ